MVTDFNASNGGRASSFPRTVPERAVRQTAHQMVSSMSGWITGESWWKVTGMPAFRAEDAGLI